MVVQSTRGLRQRYFYRTDVMLPRVLVAVQVLHAVVLAEILKPSWHQYYYPGHHAWVFLYHIMIMTYYYVLYQRYILMIVFLEWRFKKSSLWYPLYWDWFKTVFFYIRIINWQINKIVNLEWNIIIKKKLVTFYKSYKTQIIQFFFLFLIYNYQWT